MDIKNFEKYVKICRKLGVVEFKTEGFEVKLDPNPPKSPYKSRKEKETAIVEAAENEEETLFWSSGGIPMENGVTNA